MWNISSSLLLLTLLFYLHVGVVLVEGGGNHTSTSRSHHANAKIAISTQGKAKDVIQWISIISNMQHEDRVVLFLLSYDEPISETYCNNTNSKVSCQFQSGSSWTSGRNLLARNIANYEIQHHHNFKYWIFADADLSELTHCNRATICQPPTYPARSPQLATCCYNVAIDTLLAPEVQYAVVNFVNYGVKDLDYLSFAHVDCADAALVAVHRHAAPVVLPYIELVDKYSWYDSQGLLYQVLVGCLQGYSVFSNIFTIVETSAHSEYPKGRFADYANKSLHEVYGKVGLMPFPISGTPVLMGQGNCADAKPPNPSISGLAAFYEPKIPIVEGQYTPKTLTASDAWQNTTRFQQCLSALKLRFVRYIHGEALEKIDGKPFQ